MAGEDAADAATKDEKPWEYDGPESLTLTLLRPLKLHKEDPNPITELLLSEPEVGHMSAFTVTQNKTRDEFEAGAMLIHKNTGISIAHARKLGSRDFEKALTFLMGFTTPPTAGTS